LNVKARLARAFLELSKHLGHDDGRGRIEIAHRIAANIKSCKRYVYFWADGIHVQARLEDDAQCLLVIIGATPEGKEELVGLIDGLRESAQSWKELLLDLKRRGLAMGPELAVADGALGFWKALPEVWPKTREQRCWVHKTANTQSLKARLSLFPDPDESDSCRTMEVRHVSTDTVAAGF
jgi:hypothetical protein